MYGMSFRVGAWLRGALRPLRLIGATGRRSFRRQDGQTTAEYALVILAAAAVALVLLAWAQSTGKLPDFFDKVIDDLINSF